MSDYTFSTSAPARNAAWVTLTSTCATRAAAGMSPWSALAIAPGAASVANRKHGRGARAFEDPV